MDKTLVLRCPDGRNTLGLMLGFPDFQELGILEAPQIAACPPDDIIHIVLQNEVNRILVINHTTLPYCEGCGGLDAYKHLNGDASRTSSWLRSHVVDSDPFAQAITSSSKLSKRIPAEIEVTTFLFDHLLQLLFPIGTKLPYRDWLWVEYVEWKENGLTNTKTLNPKLLNSATREMLEMNRSHATFAREIAYNFEFAKGQSFDNLILNTTPYPPETIWPEIVQFESDQYFSVYTSALFPDKAIAQIEYALHLINKFTNLWVLSQDTNLIMKINCLLDDSEIFQLKRHLIKVDGILVTEKPY